MNKYKSNTPICAGMLGWDITTIGKLKTKSYGGAVLHYVAASAIIGINFKIISYVSFKEWNNLLIGLDNQGIDTSNVIDYSENIEFYNFYDTNLNFINDKFFENIPKNEPNIVEILNNTVQQDQFVHLCPTTPELDIISLQILKNKNAKISMQLHIVNLLKDVNSYRKILKSVDYLFMNEEEAKILSGKKNIDLAIEELSKFFHNNLYITSSKKVFAITRKGRFECSSMKLDIVDPTGAGDAFAGGCTAGRILTGRHDIGLRMGILCAASKLTGYSSNSLLSLLNIPA